MSFLSSLRRAWRAHQQAARTEPRAGHPRRNRSLASATRPVVDELERRMLLSAVALPSFVHPSEYAVYGANDDGTAGDPVTLDIMSGDISIDANLASAGGGWANATINLHADAHVYFNSAQTITGGLTLADYAQATVAEGSGGSNTNLLDLGALSIDANAKLDLTDNAMILRNGNSTGESAVQSLIERGAGVNADYNGWDWSGTGITSSVAAADPSLMTGVGYALNDGYDTTDGNRLPRSAASTSARPTCWPATPSTATRTSAARSTASIISTSTSTRTTRPATGPTATSITAAPPNRWTISTSTATTATASRLPRSSARSNRLASCSR